MRVKRPRYRLYSCIQYRRVLKERAEYSCVLERCVFLHRKQLRGSFLLKLADTLILKQPQEANLHLDHFRCFHRKSAQKPLLFSLLSPHHTPHHTPHPHPPTHTHNLTPMKSKRGIHLNFRSMEPNEERIGVCCSH